MASNEDFGSELHLEKIQDLGFLIDDQIQLVGDFFRIYSQKELRPRQGVVLDLYRAICCYRLYKDVNNFLDINPELVEYKHDIELLWGEFASLSETELAEVCLRLLQEV